jgi:NNMT/PNMT/TEMT family protein
MIQRHLIVRFVVMMQSTPKPADEAHTGALALRSPLEPAWPDDADEPGERPQNGPHLGDGAHPDGHEEPRHNDDVEWRDFVPEAYWLHNYRYLREDDCKIIHAVGAFFSKHFAAHKWPVARGIDVGSGANLYPALSMLPWCNAIDLTDHSPSNVAWLTKHAADAVADGEADWGWQPFWDEFTVHEGYSTITGPRAALAAKTAGNIHRQNVFALPEARYDLGTMFFVAESMTSFENEFDRATARFLNCLRPGSPFAAAFMDSSVGYVVADKSFPAVEEVGEDVVRKALQRLGATADVSKIFVPAKDPLRDGYDGMIIAVGHTAP